MSEIKELQTIEMLSEWMLRQESGCVQGGRWGQIRIAEMMRSRSSGHAGVTGTLSFILGDLGIHWRMFTKR